MHSSQRATTEGAVAGATAGCDGPRASTPIDSDQSYGGLDKRWNLSSEWQPLITEDKAEAKFSLNNPYKISSIKAT